MQQLNNILDFKFQDILFLTRQWFLHINLNDKKQSNHQISQNLGKRKYFKKPRILGWFFSWRRLTRWLKFRTWLGTTSSGLTNASKIFSSPNSGQNLSIPWKELKQKTINVRSFCTSGTKIDWSCCCRSEKRFWVFLRKSKEIRETKARKIERPKDLARFCPGVTENELQIKAN